MRASSSSLRWPPESTRAGSPSSADERHEVEQRPRLLDGGALLARRRGRARRQFGQDALAGLAAARRAAHSPAPSSRRRAAGSGRCGRGRGAMRRMRRLRRRSLAAVRAGSSPPVGLRLPARRLNSVVLPAPFGPISPTMSPRSTDSETPSTAVMPPKCFDTERLRASALSTRNLAGALRERVGLNCRRLVIIGLDGNATCASNRVRVEPEWTGRTTSFEL